MPRHDKHSAGRSQIIPHRKCEGPKDRHERRLTVNLRNKQIVEQWCADNGVVIKINNQGHHWMFSQSKKIVEWWPSSAKLIINKQWNNGIHIHDYEQALVVLKREFSK